MPVTNHAENIIEIKNISFRYDRQEALRDITLDIHRGDYLGIIGPNGSGKTTLIKIVLGLLKPSAGSIRLFGQDAKNFKDWSKIGYVPQKQTASESGFPATVREVVAMARFAKRRFLKRLTPQDHAMIEKALAQVDMRQHKDRLIEDLSGGQKQRVFIARALATEPEVIFLDEPTASIDVKLQDDFYQLLKKLNREEKLTLVLVSHDIERITKEAMHIACVDRTLVCHASPEEFLKASKSLNLFGQEVKIIAHRHDHT